MSTKPRFTLQFSLRWILAALTGCSVFLGLVKMSDLPSAILFVLCVSGLLLPILATFGSLYLELKGISLSRRRRARFEGKRTSQSDRSN